MNREGPTRWKNKKTGKLYVIVGNGIDATIFPYGLRVIFYRSDNGLDIFIIKEQDFFKNFDQVEVELEGR